MVALDGSKQCGRFDCNASLFSDLALQAIQQTLTSYNVTSGNGEATSSHVNQNEPIIRKTETMYGRYRL